MPPASNRPSLIPDVSDGARRTLGGADQAFRASGPPEPGRLSAAEAARRLGVKRETLYSYVSRGLLMSHRGPGPGRRQSSFDEAEVRRLAERRRAGGRAQALELVVDSGLTLLDPRGGLWFRGWGADDASRRASFEEIAEWLWASEGPAPFVAGPAALQAALNAQRVLPGSARPVDRLPVIVAAAAAADPLRFDRRPGAVAATGRRIIAAMVDGLPVAGADGQGSGAGGGAGGGGGSTGGSDLTTHRPGPSFEAASTEQQPVSVVARLAERLCPDPAQRTARRRRALEAALVLLADHEMASSTLAARVAASTWADPYLVVLAGLSALGGPLHGGAPDRLVPLVRDAVERGAATAVGDRLGAGEALGGFGHSVYTVRDPRADALWPFLAAGWPGSPVLGAVAELIEIVAGSGDTFPNADLALATLVSCAGMVPGAGAAIFAVARCAGWLAHAMEEYEHRLRFRIRAAYTGPEPRATRPTS